MRVSLWRTFRWVCNYEQIIVWNEMFINKYARGYHCNSALKRHFKFLFRVLLIQSESWESYLIQSKATFHGNFFLRQRRYEKNVICLFFDVNGIQTVYDANGLRIGCGRSLRINVRQSINDVICEKENFKFLRIKFN